MASGMLSLSTWRNLGLGTGIMFLGLGAACFIMPYQSCGQLGITPLQDSPSDPTVSLIKLLGARDLTLGTALSLMCYYRYDKPAAILILSTLILPVVDTPPVLAANGPVPATLFVAIAAAWMAIGLGLWNES